MEHFKIIPYSCQQLNRTPLTLFLDYNPIEIILVDNAIERLVSFAILL
jgi:hypothetical protein